MLTIAVKEQKVESERLRPVWGKPFAQVQAVGKREGQSRCFRKTWVSLQLCEESKQ